MPIEFAGDLTSEQIRAWSPVLGRSRTDWAHLVELSLHDLGADSTIRLDKPGQDLTEAFAREAGDAGFDVIIDYLWGPTTEALLAPIARRDLKQTSCRVRLVEVGESAGPTISLPAAVLRSSRLEILGAGSGNAAATPEIWIEAIRHLMSNIGCGTLRIDTERVPLCEVENAWHQKQHVRRAVIIP